MKRNKPTSTCLVVFVFALLTPWQLVAYSQHHDLDPVGSDAIKGPSGNGRTLHPYTLFNPADHNSTYLINSAGEVVHAWECEYSAGAVYLREDGHLLRTSRLPGPTGGAGGFQVLAWDGSVVWEFQYTSQHHDIEGLPNGNVLMITREDKTIAEAIAEGRDPALLTGNLLRPLRILEVERDGSGGSIVWEWHLWDHLIQDFDSTKNNYGNVADHPELLDINFAKDGVANWIHTNSIAYHPLFDQIVVSSRKLCEIWVIDHSTTTAQAAGHTGGASGKGGDILYRWGNPQAYRAGTIADQQLFGQHDAQWIDTGCPGAGNLLLFNNGLDRPGEVDYSSVDELVSPVDQFGNYYLAPGSAYGPAAPIWSYTAEDPPVLYAQSKSGCQRLPDGNTLICDSSTGYFFEVTHEKHIVWEHLNQFPSLGATVFKIRRYDLPSSIECENAGDLTGDGSVDGRDIACMRDCLLSGTTSNCPSCDCADLNGDGTLGMDDLDLFVTTILE